MVVQRHHSALLYEEQYQAVVLRPLNSDAVQLFLEVFSIFGSFYPELVQVHGIHLLDELLAAWVVPSVVEESDGVACLLRAEAHFFDGINEGAHLLLKYLKSQYLNYYSIQAASCTNI